MRLASSSSSSFSVLLIVTSLLSLLSATTKPVFAAPIQLYGLNYNTRKGPDWDPFRCKSRAEILTDLTLLKRITNRIRLLSLTDCYQVEYLLEAAESLGMQLWLGLWVSFDEEVFVREKLEFENLLNQGLIDDTTVLGITVGSESIYRDEVTLNEILDYKDEVKGLLIDAGLENLPLSIVDIAPTYIQYPSLTAAVDVVITNTFPFWENVPIDESVDDLYSDIIDIQNQPQAQNKDFVIGETGWPSDGYIEGVGTASPELQTQYFRDFFCKIDRELNWKYYYFTGIDNAWRREQDRNNTIEGNWGFLYADLTLKPHFHELVFTCSDGVEYSFAEVNWTIPIVDVDPAPVDPDDCAAHSACSGLGGKCCPTVEGGYLGCCDNIPEPPTESPSIGPTFSPTQLFSESPTSSITSQITTTPTTTPTSHPSVVSPLTTSPTNLPTDSLTTSSPSSLSSVSPTTYPTKAPTTSPTKAPTTPPTLSPTIVPTEVLTKGSMASAAPSIVESMSPSTASSAATWSISTSGFIALVWVGIT